jgi:hypothetical protein
VGKHSSPESATFWRSALIVAARRFGVVLLILLVALGFWRLVIRRDEAEQPAEEIPGEESGALPGIDLPVDSVPSPSPTSPAAGRGRIQVLNGSGVAQKSSRAEARLKQEGYEVVTRANTPRRYQKTTVFFQPGSQAEADSVVSLLGVGAAQPAPDNLDESIPISVVIGADYPG